MKTLKLPLFIETQEKYKWLSMNDYLEFLKFNSTHFPKRRGTKKDEAVMRVSAPFSIQ